MADLARFTMFSFVIGSSPAPLVMGELSFDPQHQEDTLQSAGSLIPDLIQRRRSWPQLTAVLGDPSLVLTPQAIGTSPATITGIARAYDENGGYGAGYKSYAIAKGLLYPVSLKASQKQAARLTVRALAAFVDGTAITVGTTSATPATITAAYYPTSLTLGGTASLDLIDLGVDWTVNVQDLEEPLPSSYYYDKLFRTGTATVRDLGAISQTRLVLGETVTCVALFTDQNNGSNTVSVDLGTARVTAALQGNGLATLTFKEVAA